MVTKITTFFNMNKILILFIEYIYLNFSAAAMTVSLNTISKLNLVMEAQYDIHKYWTLRG